MKIFVAALVGCLVIATAGAADPAQPNPRKASPKTEPKDGSRNIELPSVAAGPGKASESGKLLSSDLGGRELKFLQAATDAGRRQLLLAELAKLKGDSEQVRAVAAALASTQAEENKQVARLAADKGLSLAGSSPKKLSNELAELFGPKFDKMWMERLITANQDAVAAYEAGATVADPEIKAFAEQLLPLAKSKLQVATRLAGISIPGKTSLVAQATERAAAAPAPAATLPPAMRQPAATPRADETARASATPRTATPKPGPTPGPATSPPPATPQPSDTPQLAAVKPTATPLPDNPEPVAPPQDSPPQAADSSKDAKQEAKAKSKSVSPKAKPKPEATPRPTARAAPSPSKSKPKKEEARGLIQWMRQKGLLSPTPKPRGSPLKPFLNSSTSG